MVILSYNFSWSKLYCTGVESTSVVCMMSLCVRFRNKYGVCIVSSGMISLPTFPDDLLRQRLLCEIYTDICCNDIRLRLLKFFSHMEYSEHKMERTCLFFHRLISGTKLFNDWLGRWKLTLSDPTSDLVQQYDFPVSLRCRKTSDTVFVAFVYPLPEPVRRFFSCSTDFSQQIAQVVRFLFLHVFLF
jgi:hypothetical protein